MLHQKWLLLWDAKLQKKYNLSDLSYKTYNIWYIQSKKKTKYIFQALFLRWDKKTISWGVLTNHQQLHAATVATMHFKSHNVLWQCWHSASESNKCVCEYNHKHYECIIIHTQHYNCCLSSMHLQVWEIFQSSTHLVSVQLTCTYIILH